MEYDIYFESGKILIPKDTDGYKLEYGSRTLEISREMKKLEKQLREYPYGKKRDLIDVLAYIIRNMGYSRIRGKKKVYDPNSFEAIIQQLKDKEGKGKYMFAKARAYSANASPPLW